MKVTQDDLLDALRGAMQQQPGGEGQTVDELSAVMGMRHEKVRNALKDLAKQGRLQVSTVRRPSIDGRMFAIPAYRIKAA